MTQYPTPDPTIKHPIDVWEIILPESLEKVPSLFQELSLEEKERFHAILFPKACAVFGTTRLALREILSRYTGKSPGDIELTRNAFGKPVLQGHPVYFNLSHTEGRVVIAVCRTLDLGIDLEKIREQKEMRSIAEKFFSEKENAAIIAAKDPEECLNVFYAIWTRKEAVEKITGQGLAFPLNSFSVCMAVGAEESFIEVSGEKPGK